MSRPPASGVVSAPQGRSAPPRLEDVEAVRAVTVGVARIGSQHDVLTARPRHQHVRGRCRDVVVVPEERDVTVAELLVVERVADARHLLVRPAPTAVARAGVPRLDTLVRVRRADGTADPLVRERDRAEVSDGAGGRSRCRCACRGRRRAAARRRRRCRCRTGDPSAGGSTRDFVHVPPPLVVLTRYVDAWLPTPSVTVE